MDLSSKRRSKQGASLRVNTFLMTGKNLTHISDNRKKNSYVYIDAMQERGRKLSKKEKEEKSQAYLENQLPKSFY